MWFPASAVERMDRMFTMIARRVEGGVDLFIR